MLISTHANEAPPIDPLAYVNSFSNFLNDQESAAARICAGSAGLSIHRYAIYFIHLGKSRILSLPIQIVKTILIPIVG